MEGTPFGRYRLLELLGRGGMGEVWRAHDTATGRVVAVKVLPAHLAEDEVFQERFRREAYAAAALNEPHVIPIHNFGEIEGRLYVDMRLVEGRDLDTVLAGGALEPARAVHIVEQVAAALDAAHHAGLVHRDVKPSNILIGRHDFAYLIDFGIARAADQTALTSKGSTIGTWAYMSPERLSTGEGGPPADIYALTCVLYECLTGERPFPGNVEQQVTGHLTKQPPRPSVTRRGVSPRFDAVIAKGMAKDPDERYRTTLELAQAARAALTAPAEEVTTPAATVPMMPNTVARAAVPAPPMPPYTPAPAYPPHVFGPAPRRRNRAAIVIAALVAVVAVATGIVVVVNLAGKQDDSSSATGAEDTPGAQPAGPVDGTFTAKFGSKTDLIGRPYEGSLFSDPLDGAWSFHSACKAGKCVATATLTNPDNEKWSRWVFDKIDDKWVAVTVRPGKCENVDTDLWAVLTLDAKADGTMSGTYVQTAERGCSTTQAVTFTRTGDVDPAVQVADPTSQTPRLVSKAQALHGRYHNTVLWADGRKREDDFTVRTDCLRTGDRCQSIFYTNDGVEVMMFQNGQWTRTIEHNLPCNKGGTQHQVVTQNFPLPVPEQDPIMVLTGRGHAESTGSACVGGDFEEKFERIGD